MTAILGVISLYRW